MDLLQLLTDATALLEAAAKQSEDMFANAENEDWEALRHKSREFRLHAENLERARGFIWEVTE